MAQWTRVASIAEIPLGSGKEFVVGSQLLAVYHTNDGWFCLDGVCPHAGGPLAKGLITGNIVTCPWHGWQFDLTSGQHCLNRNLKHPCFPVRIVGEDVEVGLSE